MDSQKVMKVCHSQYPSLALKLIPKQIAEDLYTKGFISYPRTETDTFDKAIDLKKLIEKQVQDPTWGNYAQRYAKKSSVSACSPPSPRLNGSY